jgi:diadenosine tetraphosphate (Ap4A) HIT family hydrolase
MTTETNDCLICRKHSGAFQVSGGAIYQDDLVFASHAHLGESHDSVYLGWLVVEPRRHIPGIAELNDDEAERIGLLVARLSRALKTTQGSEHIYLFVMGHAVPHLHVHLLPRYPDTPRAYWGPNIDEWPEAPQGHAADIEYICQRLREHLAGKEDRLPYGEITMLELADLRPNNWYIHADKLARARAAWEAGEEQNLPPVLVSVIDGQLSLIDGHARSYAAFERGQTQVRAQLEALENIEGSKPLYRHIHRQGALKGLRHLSDLSDRIVAAADHERLWVAYCQRWLDEASD